MSALKLCPSCGAEYPANERFCPRDGTALRAQGGGTDLVGSIIAERYHVIRKLGEGGMGQVYLAEHVKMGRKSAVKVMNPGMVNDADAISRFNREASNASRINHPNVAGIYDFGETSDGLIYLAMEYIEGESLTALVDRTGALPALRAADITRQAAEGLATAHDMGIVHRDLKPDNIMIAKNRDGSDCVKVVDFGIAKAANSEAQKVTRTGMVVGTPEYMSPEQLAGDKLDGRSDVYSLALVAFHMLTGLLPFPSETVQESMIMRLTDKPKALRDMKPDVSWTPEVQAVMDKALARDAKLRYQLASEFGSALYTAVAAMPKEATVAAGAVELDARTIALPATRIGVAPGASPGVAPENAARAESAAAPLVTSRRRRMPVLVGGGVLVAAAIGAAMLMGRDGSAGTRAAAASALAATATVPPPGAPAGSSTGAPVAAANGPVSQPVATRAQETGSALAARPREPSGANPGSAGTAPALDIGARLPALLDESSTEGGAAGALATAQSLLPRAVQSSDLVGLGLVRAQALGVLGRDAESCAVLHSVKGTSSGTPYARRIAQLMSDAGC